MLTGSTAAILLPTILHCFANTVEHYISRIEYYAGGNPGCCMKCWHQHTVDAVVFCDDGLMH